MALMVFCGAGCSVLAFLGLAQFAWTNCNQKNQGSESLNPWDYTDRTLAGNLLT
jgi:hypothetical protein